MPPPTLSLTQGPSPAMRAPDQHGGRVAPEVPALAPWYMDDADAMPVLEEKSGDFERIIREISGGEVGTASGVSVSADGALRVATVFACIRVIAEDIAKLGLHLYRATTGQDQRARRSKATDHPLYALLRHQPNEWQTAFEFIECMIIAAHLDRNGSAYAIINRDRRTGHILELLPLPPDTVTLKMDDRWGVTYVYRALDGDVIYRPGEILVLRGPMVANTEAASALAQVREAIGLSRAIELQQGKLFASGGRPSGVLSTEKPLTKEGLQNIREAWAQQFGPNGAGGIAVLDSNGKYTPITMTNEQAQLNDGRRFLIEEICRGFRVFPQVVMQPTSSQAFASAEQFFEAHKSHTLQPWAERLEQAGRRDLLTEAEKADGYYLKFNLNALARTTLADRTNAYGRAISVYMTPNEVREAEDMDPHDDPVADQILFPLNTTASQQQPPADPPPAWQPAPRSDAASPAPVARKLRDELFVPSAYKI